MRIAVTETQYFKDWSFEHWQYLYGKPSSSAIFKKIPEDFIVRENLGFELTNEGENLFLLIEKTELNTQQVCEYLAKYFNKRLRDIGYAGLKDKQSISQQWFSVQMNVKQEVDLSSLGTEHIKLIDFKRHNKKLKIGALKSNHFEIRLRNVSDSKDVIARFEKVQLSGVPNYFGLQRFGFKGNNLNWADRMSSGEVIKNKKIKGFALSASRSYLFNQVISKRLALGIFNAPQSGDVFMLSGTNSFFVEPPSEEITQRILERDISISAPLFGEGDLVSENEIMQLEHAVAQEHSKWLEMLQQQGLKQERRSISLIPENLSWQQQEQDLIVSFDLATGCFATSVLRECVNFEIEDENEDLNK